MEALIVVSANTFFRVLLRIKHNDVKYIEKLEPNFLIRWINLFYLIKCFLEDDDHKQVEYNG